MPSSPSWTSFIELELFGALFGSNSVKEVQVDERDPTRRKNQNLPTGTTGPARLACKWRAAQGRKHRATDEHDADDGGDRAHRVPGER